VSFTKGQIILSEVQSSTATWPFFEKYFCWISVRSKPDNSAPPRFARMAIKTMARLTRFPKHRNIGPLTWINFPKTPVCSRGGSRSDLSSLGKGYWKEFLKFICGIISPRLRRLDFHSDRSWSRKSRRNLSPENWFQILRASQPDLWAGDNRGVRYLGFGELSASKGKRVRGLEFFHEIWV